MKVSNVKVYSTTTCPYCIMQTAWMDDKKVKYEKVMVDLDQKGAREMVTKTGQMGVPVTAIEYDGGKEEFIIGFNKPQLAQILEISL
jgi:glutaredoxin 3